MGRIWWGAPTKPAIPVIVDLLNMLRVAGPHILRKMTVTRGKFNESLQNSCGDSTTEPLLQWSFQLFLHFSPHRSKKRLPFLKSV